MQQLHRSKYYMIDLIITIFIIALRFLSHRKNAYNLFLSQ